MIGQQDGERLRREAVDVDPGHEGFGGGREGPVDGPVLVHAFVYVFEEFFGQPGTQAVLLGLDGGAVCLPCCVQVCRRRVTQAVAVIAGVERAVEEEDAVGQGMGQIVFGRVEDALAAGMIEGAEAPQRHAQGKAQVIRGRFGIVFRCVGRQRSAFGAVDRGLRPFLGVAPGGWAGMFEFYRDFVVGFVNSKCTIDLIENFIRIRNRKDWESIDISGLIVDSWIERLSNGRRYVGVKETS